MLPPGRTLGCGDMVIRTYPQGGPDDWESPRVGSGAGPAIGWRSVERPLF